LTLVTTKKAAGLRPVKSLQIAAKSLQYESDLRWLPVKSLQVVAVANRPVKRLEIGRPKLRPVKKPVICWRPKLRLEKHGEIEQKANGRRKVKCNDSRDGKMDILNLNSFQVQ
jgi:hypothetical protein